MKVNLPDFLSQESLDTDDPEGSVMTVFSLVLGVAAAAGIAAAGVALKDRAAGLLGVTSDTVSGSTEDWY